MGRLAEAGSISSVSGTVVGMGIRCPRDISAAVPCGRAVESIWLFT